MGRLRLVWVLVLVGGCLEPRVQHCASGLVCPAGTTCDDANDRCISDEQTVACEPLDEGDPCTIGGADGICEDGACIPTSCGDGRITGIEDCEPDLPITVDCIARGYYEPDGLGCRVDCRFDESGCTGSCGDGDRNGPEVCEGTDLGGTDCETFGYYSPDGITCNPASCTFDLSHCEGRCGDLVVDIGEGESCDGPPPPGNCVEFGFDAGALRCSPFCTPGFAACGHIGWSSEDLGIDVFSGKGVWAASLDDIYIVGTYGNIVHGRRGSWSNENLSNYLAAVHGFGDDVFAVGTAGQILRRDATTGTWPAMDAHTDENLGGIWGTAVDDLWAVGGVIDHFDGTNWVASDLPVGAGELFAVHGSGSTDVWAVGRGGTILYWDGAAWSSVASPTLLDLDDVWASGPADAWAVGDELLHWDGVSWEVVATAPNAETFISVWGANRDDVTASTSNGTVMHWDGRRWTTEEIAPGGSYDMFGIDGVLLAAGGPVLWYREATTWLVSAEVAPRIQRVWQTDPDDVWAITIGGDLSHWDGVAWTPTPVTGVNDVWASGPDDVWAVGYVGVLWHYSNATWTAWPDFGTTDVGAVWGSGPDDVWAIGAGTTFHWNGSTWTSSAGAAVARRMWGSGPDDIWTIGRFGSLRHYDGSQWSDWPQDLAYEFTFDLWGAAADDVWAVSWSGLLFHYDGASWEQVAVLATESSTLFGTAPDDVYVFGNAGEARHFDGTAWAPMREQVDISTNAAWGDRGTVLVGGELIDGSAGLVTRMELHTRWACRASEQACGDAIDDDCDALVDGDDTDCLGAVVLDEIHGGAEDYVELRNRTGATVSLAGLTVQWQNGCSQKSARLGGAAIVKPGGTYRVVHDRSPHPGEAWTEPLCDTPDGNGWVALCSGECELVGCRNVLDFVSRTGTGAAIASPVCADTVPAPPSVLGATATQSLTRVGYTHAGPKAAQADWAVVAATRD